jgi:hypothetical protein
MQSRELAGEDPGREAARGRVALSVIEHIPGHADLVTRTLTVGCRCIVMTMIGAAGGVT